MNFMLQIDKFEEGGLMKIFVLFTAGLVLICLVKPAQSETGGKSDVRPNYQRQVPPSIPNINTTNRDSDISKDVISMRLLEDGSLDAMAAGGLRYFEAGRFKIELEQPVYIALWRDEKGVMQGVLCRIGMGLYQQF